MRLSRYNASAESQITITSFKKAKTMATINSHFKLDGDKLTCNLQQPEMQAINLHTV